MSDINSDHELEEFQEELDEDFDDAEDIDGAEDIDDDAASSVAEPASELSSQASGITLPTLPITGEPRVDAALARLGDLAGMPVGEHVEVFEDVHRRLHGTLADLAG